MVGGQTSANSMIDRLQIYDVDGNSWTDEQIDIWPIRGNGWDGQYCQVVNNVLYVFGGYIGSNNGYFRFDGILKYDTIPKWKNIGSLPQAQAIGTSVYYQRYIYIIGGYLDNGESLDSIYEFDVDSETIHNTYNMQQSLDSLTADIINNKLHIFGGEVLDDVQKNVQICDTLKTFDPTIDPSEWDDLTTMSGLFGAQTIVFFVFCFCGLIIWKLRGIRTKNDLKIEPTETSGGIEQAIHDERMEHVEMQHVVTDTQGESQNATIVTNDVNIGNDEFIIHGSDEDIIQK